MLRLFRIILAIISFLAVTALFVDVTGFAAQHWAWMAKIQFIPAVLSLNLLAVIVLIVLTLVLGRVYCSVICPLGIYQDIVSRISIIFSKKKTRKLGKFRFSINRKILRISIFAIFTTALIFGLISSICTILVSLLEPYSAFGRMAVFFGRPLSVVILSLIHI